MSKPSAGFFKKKEPTISNVKPCGNRDTKLFVEYLKGDRNNINLLIAKALLKTEQLEWFELEEDDPHGNECVFSYPDSDWYSVYLKTPNGDIVWTMDDETGDVIHPKFYFKIEISPDGSDAKIIESSFEVPKGLKTKKNCQVINGECVDPPGPVPRAQKTEQEGPPPEPKKRGRPPKAQTAGPQEIPEPVTVSPEMIAQLTSLKVGTPGAGPSGTKKAPGKVSRDFFEKMQSKDKLVEWMVNNLDRSYLVSCIMKNSSGQFNPEELSNIESLANLPVPELSEGPVSQEEVPALVAASQLKPQQVTKMLTKISFGSIKKDLMDSISGLQGLPKKQAIVDFCVRSGINDFRAGLNKKGLPKIFDSDDEPIDESLIVRKVVDFCVRGEVYRLRKKIAEGLQTLASTREQEVQAAPEELVSEQVPVNDYESKIQEILTLKGVPLMNAVAEFCNNLLGDNVYVVKKNKKGEFRLYDDDEVVDSGEYENVMRSLLPTSSFGFGRRTSKKQKAHRLKFKKAVKKCKKSRVKNFRKCMSKNLKKRKN
jgi:hypothetical protein